MRLDDGIPVAPTLLPRLVRLVGDEPVLSWGAAAGHTPVIASKKEHPQNSRSGWGVVTVSPPGSTSAAVDAAALVGATGGTSRARISLAMIRPAALASVLGRDDGLVPGLARRIESLRWDAWLRNDGMVEATVNLRMAR